MVRATAGASARREHERRKSRDEDRIRTKHPHLGGLILALSDDPQSTKAWAAGARGEELLARQLDTLAGAGVLLLHDRRIPRTRANIDHLAVAPAGVYVIDAKRYRGRPHLRVDGGLLRPRAEKLLVGSRDCTPLVGGVQRQADLVHAALAEAGHDDVPVHAMLCFVRADWTPDPRAAGGALVLDLPFSQGGARAAATCKHRWTCSQETSPMTRTITRTTTVKHVRACQTITVRHQDLTWPALVRIFGLAEVGTDDTQPTQPPVA